MKKLGNKFFAKLILMRIRLVPTVGPVARDIFDTTSLMKNNING